MNIWMIILVNSGLIDIDKVTDCQLMDELALCKCRLREGCESVTAVAIEFAWMDLYFVETRIAFFMRGGYGKFSQTTLLIC